MTNGFSAAKIPLFNTFGIWEEAFMTHLLLIIIYLAFISLGLPDSLLGAAWPSIYPEIHAPMSTAGVISFIIAVGTIISSLNSDRLTKKLGAGVVTAASVFLTAAAIFGFSVSNSFLMLCLFAVPYGLGAGGVDAALNNYVALHYSSKHMSWLHCMWGLGAVSGPYIIAFGLKSGHTWRYGYTAVFAAQAVLTAILFLSLPLWKKQKTLNSAESEPQNPEHIKLSDVVKIPGAKSVMLTFFCYCAVEQTVMLWAGSYMVLKNGFSPKAAADYMGLFFIGITVGRMINGFLTVKFSDTALIRLGQIIIASGIILMLLPFGNILTLIGILLIGLGCAPIYPCIIHSTPAHFGAEKSQSLIGVQMASAYVGTSLMPPLFGFIAGKLSVSLLPFYLVILLGIMIISHEKLNRQTRC